MRPAAVIALGCLPGCFSFSSSSYVDVATAFPLEIDASAMITHTSVFVPHARPAEPVDCPEDRTEIWRPRCERVCGIINEPYTLDSARWPTVEDPLREETSYDTPVIFDSVRWNEAAKTICLRVKNFSPYNDYDWIIRIPARHR